MMSKQPLDLQHVLVFNAMNLVFVMIRSCVLFHAGFPRWSEKIVLGSNNDDIAKKSKTRAQSEQKL